MSLRRYLATKDNTITNAYEANLTTRGTGSNMGLADSLEVFSIFGQANSSSSELTRFLVQFPVSSSDTGTTILADRTAGIIPASGSVNFYLRVFDVVSTKTLPIDFTLNVSPVSQSWQEGYGLDMENYSDQTYNGTGSNWINASSVGGYGTSTITIVDYSIIEGDPSGITITIITTDGTIIGAYGAAGEPTTTTDTDTPTFEVATSNANTATNLATCLDANSKLSATRLGGVVTVVQAAGGLIGNTAVSDDFGNPAALTVTDFTGGSGGAWTNEGGDYLTASAYSAYNYSQTFTNGREDLEVDITGLVEQWIKGTSGGGYENYGVGVFLTSSEENGNRSYYSKMFSARGSEYFFKRPIIEARWDDSRKDHRGTFYLSSSNLSAADNLNTIYFYNYVRQQLTDLPGVSTGSIYVNIYDSSSAGTQITTTPNQPVTGGWVATGIYSASFALTTTEEVVYDRWFSGSTYYYTGSIKPKSFDSSAIYETQDYITSISNLRSAYSRADGARLRVYTRKKNWNPTIYTVAQAGIQNYIIDKIYYKVIRTIDDYVAVPYGTGSIKYTELSYDVSGSYFDLDVSLLESGFEYGLSFSYYVNGAYDEHHHTYKFKVIE